MDESGGTILEIDDKELEIVENILLEKGCHFANDAKEVIRYWKSVDVAACPGSGKTTVLLAKLKLLADRMPLKKVRAYVFYHIQMLL